MKRGIMCLVVGFGWFGFVIYTMMGIQDYLIAVMLIVVSAMAGGLILRGVQHILRNRWKINV